MSSSPYVEVIDEISSNIGEFEPIADKASAALGLSMSWVGHYINTIGHEPSALILKGAYGCAVESVTLISFGLLRPAMLSLRSHYELCLQYLYFRDHPVELQSLLDFRVQGPLPSAVKKYLREHSPTFGNRFSKLSNVRNREFEEIYGILSGVAHGNALHSISTATHPKGLLEEKSIVDQSIPVFLATGEIISDMYLSDFSSNWMSVPASVQADVGARLKGKNAANELSM